MEVHSVKCQCTRWLAQSIDIVCVILCTIEEVPVPTAKQQNPHWIVLLCTLVICRVTVQMTSYKQSWTQAGSHAMPIPLPESPSPRLQRVGLILYKKYSVNLRQISKMFGRFQINNIYIFSLQWFSTFLH